MASTSSDLLQDKLCRLHRHLIIDIANTIDSESGECQDFLFHIKETLGAGIYSSHQSLADKIKAIETKNVFGLENYEGLKNICKDSGNLNLIEIIETCEDNMKKIRSKYQQNESSKLTEEGIEGIKRKLSNIEIPVPEQKEEIKRLGVEDSDEQKQQAYEKAKSESTEEKCQEIKRKLSNTEIPVSEQKEDLDYFLDPDDTYILLEALKKGSSEDKYLRINIVGNFNQGKTSLTRRLLNQSLENIKSTDGIDVHVRKCRINQSGWENSETEPDENDCIQRLVQVTSDMKRKYEVEDEVDVIESDNTGTPLKPDFASTVADSVSSTSETFMITEAESGFLKNYSTQLKNKMSVPIDNDTLTANIWDFGGQFIYYSTHQIFHSSEAIYLLLFDLTKDFNESIKDKDFPERNDTMKSCLKFWVDSIHAYAGSEDDGLNTSAITKPIIILVGTHKDEFIGDIDEKFYNALDIFADDMEARRHILPDQFAVSNKDFSDTEFYKLKEKIFRLGIANSRTKSIPLKWIPLEMALLAEKSKNIISLEDIRNLNSKHENLVEENEIKTFLKYLHIKGTLIFFDEVDLDSHIVVNPQYLVDAFRCIIGTKSCIKDADLHLLWKRFKKSSILEKKLLDAMWEKEFENAEVLLMFLQKHRILARLNVMDEAGNVQYQERYMIPSLLKHSMKESEVKSYIGGKKSTRVLLCLQLKNSAILSNLFIKVIAGALGKWPPAEKGTELLIFQNVGHFRLDLNHVGKVEQKSKKGIVLTVINGCQEDKVDSKICDYFRRYIESLINHELQKQRKNTNSHPYTYQLSCNNTEHGGIGSEKMHDLEEVKKKVWASCPDSEGHSIACKSAVEEWFLPRDNFTIPRRRVTNEELNKIAQCIGFNWELLGGALHISKTSIERLQLDNPRQTALCIYKMLCMWKQSNQEDATLHELITCIEDNGSVSVDPDLIKNIIDGN